MAQIGQKRPNQDTDSSSNNDTIFKEEPSLTSLPKRPGPSSTFSFRPSPLQTATKGFALRQSSLQPKSGPVSQSSLLPGVSPSSTTSNDSCEEQAPKIEKSGFLKLNQESLKLVGVSSYNIMGVDGKPVMTSGGSSTAANVTHSRSPFSQSDKTPLGFRSSVGDSSRENYFAVTNQTQGLAATPTSDNGVTPSNQQDETKASTSSSGFLEEAKVSPKSEQEEGDSEQSVFGAPPKQPPLPEVHAFTGEESEKSIVVISAKLYAFEVDTRTWKDRGRGEIRLNDSAKDEGVFQSRLVMRASGTYRVLLNTHLWSQMSCERANQKSIRITAQHIATTDDIGVYLITGAAKDIQQLFTAIDRRIQALRRNIPSENEDSSNDQSAQPVKPVEPDEEEDKDESLSCQSTPESSPEAIRIRPIDRPPVISVSSAPSTDRGQRSRSSEPSTDHNGDKSPPSDRSTDNATPTSEHIS